MMRFIILLALATSINTQLVKELMTFVQSLKDDPYLDQISFDPEKFDISTPPKCEECTCSANLCCPYQPLFLPALVCIRQCIRIYPIQFCVCSCLNVFDCCI